MNYDPMNRIQSISNQNPIRTQSESNQNSVGTNENGITKLETSKLPIHPEVSFNTSFAIVSDKCLVWLIVLCREFKANNTTAKNIATTNKAGTLILVRKFEFCSFFVNMKTIYLWNEKLNVGI